MPIDFIKRHNIEEGGAEQWLLSYSDMFTLLFCFFALLVSTVFTHMDWVKIEEMMKGFTKKDQMTLSDLNEKIQNIIVDYQIQEEIETQLTPRGVEISFKEKATFARGKATLKPEIYPILNIMSQLLKAKGIERRKIIVEGHTDSVPIRTEAFPSNWELSSSRAGTVVRYLIETGGLVPARFEAIGFADTKPKVALKGDQPENRRVVVVVSPDSYTGEIARAEVSAEEYKDLPKPVTPAKTPVQVPGTPKIPSEPDTPAKTPAQAPAPPKIPSEPVEDKKALMRKYFQEGQESFKAARYEEAIASWQKVLEIDPNHELSKKNIERAKKKRK